jgi:hypothetical protein
LKLKLFAGGIGLGAGVVHISHSCSAEWLINVQDVHCQLTSVLEEEDDDDNNTGEAALALEAAD